MKIQIGIVFRRGILLLILVLLGYLLINTNKGESLGNNCKKGDIILGK